MKIKATHIPRVLTEDSARILHEELRKARDQIGALYVGAVKTAIKETKPHPPIDMNTLIDGIAPTPDPLALKTSVAPSPLSNPYNVVQELGRRPGQPGPPRAPILAWVERQLGLSGDEAESAAFLIARKLHKKGMKGRFFFRRARTSKTTRAKARALVVAAVRRWKRRTTA